MAQENIHPKYNSVEIALPDGTKFKTRSTTDHLVCEVDIAKHPAWLEFNSVLINESDANVQQFKKKRGGMSFLGALTKKADAEN